MNAHKTILSLCDYSGVWSQPYKDAGYNVIQVDLKHGQDVRLMDDMRMGSCHVCGLWIKSGNICQFCLEGGETYQQWRRELGKLCAPDGFDLRGLFKTSDGEKQALQAFREGKTIQEAYEQAEQEFCDFLDSEAPEVERDNRQWRQYNAGMEVTPDGYPTPEQIEW